MALNPELVTQILSTELTRNGLPDYSLNDQARLAIETKAAEQETSPESFSGWIVMQEFFQLSQEISVHNFVRQLEKNLYQADLAVIRSEAKTKTHKILYIESATPMVEIFSDLIKEDAVTLYGIPKNHITFRHLQYPPKDQRAFIALLKEHTASILHNLDLENLGSIHEALNQNPALAQKIIIVTTGAAITSSHRQMYAKLKQQGAMIVPKPFPSIDEVVRVALQIV